MPTISAVELPERLKHEGLLCVYGLVGNEEFLVLRCLSQLKNAVEAPDSPGSMTSVFGPDAELGKVLDVLRSAPFLGLKGRKMVVLRDADGFIKSHGEALARYLANPSPTSTLAIQCEELKGKTKLPPLIRQKGHIVRCAQLSWPEARKWVTNEAEQLGKKLTPRACAALVEATGTNLFKLDNEVQKLANYVGENNTITERDIEEIVPHSRTRSIFDIADAVARADVPHALRLCEHLMLRGEKPGNIIAILARHMRQIWQVKRLKQSGANAKEIARQLNLRDFVVQKALQLASLSEELIARRLTILADADYELKTSSIRPAEENVWLMRLLARLCGQPPQRQGQAAKAQKSSRP